MDVREKLVELKKVLRECLHFNYDEFSCNMSLDVDLTAENLIAHGVTVQEWISVKDRLPTIHDANADNCVLAIHKVTNRRYYHWRTIVDNPFDFTFWSKVPEPPKGE